MKKEHNGSENKKKYPMNSRHFIDIFCYRPTEWINRKLEFIFKFESFQMKMEDVLPIQIAPYSAAIPVQINSSIWA
jgi:hypothetical protein